MKFFLLLFGLLFPVFSVFAQEWPSIPNEARPGTRWWWMGSAVDENNLTTNMKEYACAGLGELEITPIYGVQGNEASNIPYLSPRWMEMLRFTQEEGKRNDLQISMTTGTGWPFGGPEVTLEDAATQALFQTYIIQGGQAVRLDLAVQDEIQRPFARLGCLMAYQQNRCIELTKKIKGQTLYWEAPKGEWKLIALYIGKRLLRVERAAPGGEGYVIDHFSKGAVQRYLQKFDKAFGESETPYPHTFFNDSYEVHRADWTPDFLEEFARRRGYRLERYFPEFLNEERTDLTGRLLSDYRETISDLLNEYFTTQWTQWAHRHGSITRNQAHGSPSNLIDTYSIVDIPECEGFGLSSFHINGLRQDSLTRRNDSDLSMLKYASSAAHLTGKPYTSSETFTWLTEHFRASLSQCKPDMDFMFTAGVNHMFFHGTPFSPKEASWPGWQFYASVNMSPTNSIWRDAPAFFQYITRCQSFLQMGKPDNDFLVYLPIYDIWHEKEGKKGARVIEFSIHDMGRLAPEFIETVNKILECGYDVDYISDRFIQSTRCVDGKLVTQGGTSYKALIIPGAKRMPVEVLKQLIQLARQGATILFLHHYPEDVPGLSQLEKRRKDFHTEISSFTAHSSTANFSIQEDAKKTIGTRSFADSSIHPFGKGRILTGTDYARTLDLCGTPPEEMKTRYGVHAIRRKNETGYHYFISSLQNKDIDGWITLGTPAQSAALFNPMTGESGEARLRQHEGKAQVYLQLKSGESIILQTYSTPRKMQRLWTYIEEQPISLCLDHGWKFHFLHSEPAIAGTYTIDTTQSWTNLPLTAAKENMGTGVYTLDFTLPEMQADDWILDLGDVRESARVRINGKEAGTAWAVPFRIKVGNLLTSGLNRIEIEVTNLPANRIASYDRNGIIWRIFNEINMVDLKYKKTTYGHWAPMPSGLNSIVRLIPVNTK